jgi:hypothetical protein
MNPMEFVISHWVALSVALGAGLVLWFWARQRLTVTQQWVDDHLRWIEAIAVLALVAWFVFSLLGVPR